MAFTFQGRNQKGAFIGWQILFEEREFSGRSREESAQLMARRFTEGLQGLQKQFPGTIVTTVDANEITL